MMRISFPEENLRSFFQGLAFGNGVAFGLAPVAQCRKGVVWWYMSRLRGMIMMSNHHPRVELHIFIFPPPHLPQPLHAKRRRHAPTLQ